MTVSPASAGRTRFDIADIVRRHRADLEAHVHLDVEQRRVLSAIAICRTAALGGHLDTCRSCGHEHPAYNSCRNRHCPKCQALAQERWIAARSERILPVRHFHVVFTLPSQLRKLARWNPRALFDALFHAASRSLLELGRDRLGCELCATMVLHTWTRELLFHPHVHAVVTAGGLSLDGLHWRGCARDYLLPVEVLGTLLRGKMLAALNALYDQGAFKGLEAFDDPEGFDRMMRQLPPTRWLVYAKKPFRRTRHVFEYLGRYTHRVGISNSRLLDVTPQRVTFRTRGDKTTTIAPVEFLARLVDHVLPPRFVKIRHYGLLAAVNVDGKLEQARRLLNPETVPATRPPKPHSWLDDLASLTQRDVRRCPKCGGEIVTIVIPASRAPPVPP